MKTWWLRPFAFTICLATPAAAEFCDAVEDALTFEALLISDTDASTAQISQLRDKAGDIARLASRQRPPLDEPTQNAVRDYVQSVRQIQSDPRNSTPSQAVNAHKSGLHRVRTRYLRAFTDLLCSQAHANANDRADDGTPSTATPGLLQTLQTSFGTTVSLGLFLAFLGTFFLVVAGGLRLQRKRQLLRARHYCNVPVRVMFMGGGFDSTLVDISALGLKVSLPDGQHLPASVAVSFFERTVTGKVQWQNTSFAGIVLHASLPLDFVKSVSEGQIARRKSRRPNRRRKAGTQPAS